jgi:hypothetical protein
MREAFELPSRGPGSAPAPPGGAGGSPGPKTFSGPQRSFSQTDPVKFWQLGLIATKAARDVSQPVEPGRGQLIDLIDLVE